YPCKHAWPQGCVRIGYVGSQQDGTPADIDERADGPNLTLAHRVGQRIEAERQLLANLDLPEVLLGNSEIHFERIDGFDRYEIAARTDVVANGHVAQTDQAIKGRHDNGFVQMSLGKRSSGLLYLELAGRFVARLLADKPLLGQCLRAVVLAVGQTEISLSLLQFGPHHTVVQTHQYLAFADPPTFLKVEFRDAPAHLGTQHDRILGAQASNG